MLDLRWAAEDAAMRPNSTHNAKLGKKIMQNKNASTKSDKVKFGLMPPWFALMATAAERRDHHSQEYEGRAEQGAMLHSPTVHLGRHRAQMYTMKPRCLICGELQRMQPCVQT